MKKIMVVLTMVMSLVFGGACSAATDNNASQEELKPMLGVWMCGVWQDAFTLQKQEVTQYDLENVRHIEYANEPGDNICHATMVNDKGDTFGVFIRRGYGNRVWMYVVASTEEGDTLALKMVKIEG